MTSKCVALSCRSHSHGIQLVMSGDGNGGNHKPKFVKKTSKTNLSLIQTKQPLMGGVIDTSLAGAPTLCSWAKHLILAVPLSRCTNGNQQIAWGQPYKTLEVTSDGLLEILLVASYNGNRT